MSIERVNVLAEMEDAAKYFKTIARETGSTLDHIRADAMKMAADAVSELIDAAGECRVRLPISMTHTEDLVAHMRLCRALEQMSDLDD